MNRAMRIASIVLLCVSPFSVQPQSGQTEPFGFHDIQLGMPIAEFKAKHPAPKVEKFGPPGSPLPGQASCSGWRAGEQKKDLEDAARGILRCGYSETYLKVSLRVSAIFVDGKLGVIETLPPSDTPACFEPLPSGASNSARSFYSASCQQYPPLLRELTDKLGLVTTIVSTNENLKGFDVRRWETDSSVAEFQDHMCGPWDGTDRGWSLAISEVLEGTYCKRGDTLSSRQPVMLYFHKELSRTLATRMEKTTN